MRNSNPSTEAFSLIEVVLAIGVVAFAIVAILGILPIGLDTSHAAQDNTRAPQIAQSIFATLAAQAVIRDPNTGLPVVDAKKNQQLNGAAKIPQASSIPIDLSTSSPNPYQLYATNDGQVSDSNTNAIYSVQVKVDTSPAGFDPASAAQVTVSVAWPFNASSTNQVKRDFVRVISRY